MRKPRQRLVATVATLVLAFVVLRLAVDSPRFERWLTDAVQVAMEEALGEEVLLGRAELDLWPPRATLTGVVVRSQEDGRTIARLERARAWLGLGRHGPRLRLLELDAPQMRLHVDRDGLREFRDMQRGESRELPYDQLIVRGGDLTLTFLDETTVLFDGIELRPTLEDERFDLALGKVTVQRGEVEQIAEGLRFDQITVCSDRVIVPDLHVDFPLAHIQGHLGVVFGGELGGELSVDVDASELSTLFPDELALYGPLAVDIELGGTVDEPQAGLSIAAEPVLWVEGNDYVLGELSGWIEADRRGVVVHELGGVWADGFLHASSRLNWEGELLEGELILEDVSLSEALVSMGPWTAPWVDFRGDLEYHPSGSLSPLSLSGPVELNILDLEIADGPPAERPAVQYTRAGSLSGSLHFSTDGALIEADELLLDSSSGEGRAELPWAGPARVDLDLEQADLSTFRPIGGAELEGRGRVQARISGPYDQLVLDGVAEIRDFGLLGWKAADTLVTPVHTDDWVHVDFSGFQARTGKTRLHGDLELVFEEELGLDLSGLVDGRVEDLVGIFLPPTGISAHTDGTVALKGPLERLDGEVGLDLSDIELYGEPFETGRLDGRMDGGTFSLEALKVERARERLVAVGTVGAGWAMAVDLRSEGLRLEGLELLQVADESLSGALQIDARLAGTLLEPEPEGVCTLRAGRLRGEALPDLTLDFGTEDLGDERRLTGVVASPDGSLQGFGSLELVGGGSWEIDGAFRRFPLHMLWPLAADGRPVVAHIDGTVTAEGALSDQWGLDAVGQGISMVWGGRSLATTRPFSLHWDAAGWDLGNFAVAGEGTDLQFTAGGSGGEIAVDGGGQLDAVWLSALTSSIDQAAGPMVVEVDLKGPAAAPGGNVVLSFEGARLRSPAFPHPFDNVRGSLLGTPSGYQLPQEALAELGGGDVVLTGRIDADNWVPVRYALAASVYDARVDLVEDLPPMVADAELTLAGPVEDLLLSGEVQIEDMLFAERIDWEQWTVDWRSQHLHDLVDDTDQQPLFALDVAVIADGTARIRNNVGEGRMDADLRIVGDDTRIGLVGDVRMHEGGRAFLHEREFDVSRGELHYVDPYSYDPILDFVLETDIRTSDRDVHITYPVSGTLSDPQTAPRSDPSMPLEDINALLLFGVTYSELEQGGGAGAALVLEGAGLLLSSEKSRALERLGPEALEVFQYTQVDLVTGVSQRGALTSTEWRLLVEQNVEEPVDLTLVGEFSLDDSYLAAEREVYDNLYLTLYWSSEQTGRNLNIGGAYGADFKVRWESD